ncbi:MAG: hypothetical protein H3C27_11185 [Opitutaceae bacterium]|nr:hypothetical protein [Opitutaceae bacterium]
MSVGAEPWCATKDRKYMTSRHEIKRLLIGGMGMTVCSLLSASPPAGSELIGRSPFADTGMAAKPEQAVEFRGVLAESGRPLFSLYDFETKSSQWVGFNEPGGKLVVRSYDPSAQSIVVVRQGKSLNLTLNTMDPLMAGDTAAGPKPIPGQPTTGGPDPKLMPPKPMAGGPVPNVKPPSEQADLEGPVPIDPAGAVLTGGPPQNGL